MSTTLQRFSRIRVADNIDDQSDSATILGAPTTPTTQEDLQRLFLSRLRQMIFGEGASEHWYEDPFTSGILSLKELTTQSGAVFLARTGIKLVGTFESDNETYKRTFTVPLPDTFIHDPHTTGKTIEVFHNGRLLTQVPPSMAPTPENGDYTVSESGVPGSGFNTINLLTFSPVRRSRLVANYYRI